MIANINKPLSPLQKRLLDGLALIPDWIPLCLIGDKKAPLGNDWPNRPYTKDEVREAIISGATIQATGKTYRANPKGYGVITGRPVVINDQTVYLVAVDQDGSSAKELIQKLSNGEGLPETYAFTSDRPGRCQFLFTVSPEYASHLRTVKLKTGLKGDDGKEEQLELRWSNLQSVLPPSVHPETGCYRWRRSPEEVAIAPAPMWLIEQMLDEPESNVERPAQIQLPVDAIIPLTACLTHRSRDMLSTGAAALDKGRNDSGIELARDLIGTANYLDSLGQRYDPNPENLFFDWCRVCGLDSDKPKGQPKTIWKSANKGNSTPGSGRDGVDACIRGWHWRENIKPTGRSFSGGIGSGGGNRRGNGGSGGSGGDGGDGDGGGKVIRFPSFEALSVEQVTEKIDELVHSGATGSYLTGQLNRLAAASQFFIGELRKLYYERLGEADLEVDRSRNRSEVDNLLKLTDQTLNLVDYLPEALATPLTNWCSWLSMRPAVALTALLAGASSLHKVGTELVIHQNKHFEVPPTLYAALVAESGQLKSPVFSNIIRQPLNQLRREKVEAYQAAMEDYEAAMQAWEESEDKGEKPKKPADPTLYFFTNATGEAIPVQASKVPDKALLALVDELSGLFRSENAHRNGRGSDKQDLLSYFDGTGQTVLRASGVKVDVEKIYLSIFGTIQPDILKGHMSDCSDPDGQWARFLFVNQPLSFAPLGDDDGQAVSIRDRIADYYRKVERIPEMRYRLSRAAFKRYEPMHDHLERLRVTHPKPGMRAVYSKMKGIIGRLALNLHVLWELDAGKACPDEEIPLFIMEMALALAKFYIGQIKLVHADSDNESLPTHIVKLVELSKRLEANGKDGWIKAQQYRELFAAKKRPSAQQAREWMLEAATQGFGRTRGTGNRLEYHWLRDNDGSDDNPPSPPDNLGNLGKVREDLGKGVPYAEPVENKGVEDNLGNLGKGIPNSSPTNNDGYKSDEEWSKSSLEGGYVPEPSLSTTEISSDQETVDVTDLGNNLGNPFPNSSLSSPNENSHEVVTLAVNSTVNLAEMQAPGSAKPLEEQPIPLEQAASTSADKAHASQEIATSSPNEILINGEAVGRMAHFMNMKKEVSHEAWKVTKWCDRNKLYTLENGETVYPHQIILAT